jgi:peptidoglycan/LPS O-acetylase OafA/YrhL
LKINSKIIIDNRYRSDIDGLRAIAVLFVIAFHSFPNFLKGGFIGVDIFFVISGYLISLKIYDDLDKKTFNLNAFYKRRIIRIFPALILVLVTSAIIGWYVLFFDEYKQFGKHAAAGAGFMSNIVYSMENGYFENAVDTKPLLHLWSLGVEEQFYIVWPFILLFAWKRKFNIIIVVTILCVISFVFNIIEVKKNTVIAFYLPQTRFWELISGGLLAFVNNGIRTNIVKQKNKLYINTKVKLSNAQYEKLYLNTLSILGFLLLIIGLLNINSELNYPGIYAILPVMASLLLIAGGTEAWINKNILSNKIMVWLGLISYPLYLWHWPLLSLTRIIEGVFPDNITCISIILVSILLAWITFEYIEKPIRYYNNSKISFIVLIVLMIVIWFVGFIIYIKNGYPNREFEKYQNII